MKSSVLYLFIVIFVFSLGGLIQYDNSKEIYDIEILLKTRAKVINEFLYGNKDISILKKSLSLIEADELLKNDIELLTYINDNPTDYEKVEFDKINEVQNIAITKTNISMLAKIGWKKNNGNEKSIESKFALDYNIECKVQDKKIYLTKVEIVK